MFARPFHETRSSSETPCDRTEMFDSDIVKSMVAYIERDVEKGFLLSDWCILYRDRVAAKGITLKKREPNSTRFKDHLLSFLPDWSDQRKG